MKSYTEIDKQIIALIRTGSVCKEVAAKLNRTPEHIEWRLEEIRKKHKARNTPHLIYILSELENRTQAQQ